MRRLRYGDGICGLAAGALLAVLILATEGWGDLSWLTAALAAAAVAAGLAVPVLTATRPSPSGPLLALVATLVLSLLATLALLVEGAWAGLLAALVLFFAAFRALKDERQPGALDTPVQRRPAPPAGPAAPTIEA